VEWIRPSLHSTPSTVKSGPRPRNDRDQAKRNIDFAQIPADSNDVTIIIL
jgi:hypothetical protein